jgi:hypothetical protein
MPGRRAARPREPLPEPLPPETRPIGQLVAETLRLYGRRFWRSVPLGFSLAVVNQVSVERTVAEQVAVLAAASPFVTASYVGASALAANVRPSTRTVAAALGAGTLVFLPVAPLTLLFVLPAVAWLAAFGLVVPVVVVEGAGFRAAFGRAFALARADYVHALGSLATLVIVFAVTRFMLVLLLQGTGDQTERIALFLADIVLSPILYLGAALLYFDQAARAQRRGRPPAAGREAARVRR